MTYIVGCIISGDIATMNIFFEIEPARACFNQMYFDLLDSNTPGFLVLTRSGKIVVEKQVTPFSRKYKVPTNIRIKFHEAV